MGKDPDNIWYYADGSEFEHAQNVVDDYYKQYPERPGPALIDPQVDTTTATASELI